MNLLKWLKSLVISTREDRPTGTSTREEKTTGTSERQDKPNYY